MSFRAVPSNEPLHLRAHAPAHAREVGPQAVPLWKLFEKVSKTKVAAPYDITKLWFRE